MIYNFEITTPANTSEANAIKTHLKLASGIIHHVDIVFPPGSHGLLHLRVMEAVHQMFPTNSDSSFASDNEVISYREFRPILTDPLEVQAITWNLDNLYEHKLILRFGILSKAILTPWLVSWQEKLAPELGAEG